MPGLAILIANGLISLGACFLVSYAGCQTFTENITSFGWYRLLKMQFTLAALFDQACS